MIAAWPVDIPLTVASSNYSETPERSVASFKPEVGPQKDRLRSAWNASTLSITIPILTGDEVESLLTFWRDTLSQGVAPFTRQRPRTQEIATFKFASEPKIASVGGVYYSASFSLLELP